MTVVFRCPVDDLDPDFLADVTDLLSALPDTWYVLEGFRSLARSQAGYAAWQAGKGPRYAPPGKSAHNYGLAVDVVLDADGAKPGLQPSWDTSLPAWGRLKAAVMLHPRLSGGWSFGDWPHIERRNWKQFIPSGGAP